MPDPRQFRPACEAITALPHPWPELIALAMTGSSAVHTSQQLGLPWAEVIRMRNQLAAELRRAVIAKRSTA